VSEAYNLHFTWRINCQLQLWNNKGDVECRPLHKNGEFSGSIWRKVWWLRVVWQKEHELDDRLIVSIFVLNTQMYPNNINCSRIDTFSICTSTTYWQRCLPQNILPARTFTSRTTTCSCFGNIYTTTPWVIVPWQSSLLASTNIGHQQSWLSTSVNYSRLRVVSAIFKHIIVTTNIIIATNIIAMMNIAACFC